MTRRQQNKQRLLNRETAFRAAAGLPSGSERDALLADAESVATHTSRRSLKFLGDAALESVERMGDGSGLDSYQEIDLRYGAEVADEYPDPDAARLAAWPEYSEINRDNVGPTELTQ